MKLDKNKTAKRAFFMFVVMTLFFAAIMQVSSDADEKIKYSDMEKEEIGDDDESQEALQEYYGEILGKVKKNAKFNTIATQGDIVVLNVTINGKDRRILTRMRTATLFPGQQNLLNATLIRTINLVVLGNISLKGNLFFDAEESFGLRRFYGVGSTTFRYIDEGFARLVNGKANVSVNPILSELISGYTVFLSAEGLTRGIYIAEKTNSYFIVKSLNANSNVGFSWMLRGVKKDFDGKLNSEYGKEKGISVEAKIDFENGRTEISITGLDKILGLVELAPINDSNAQNNNSNNESVNITISQGSQSINLITGNLIDEFGLETDLGQILGEAADLPELTDETSADETNIIDEAISNETITNITEETVTNETAEDILDITSNETVEVNETAVPSPSVLEFTLYSTNEDFIVSQVADVTSLSLGQVRKLINFVYAEPVGFEDEVIDEPVAASLDFIEKVNGSVIIKLG